MATIVKNEEDLNTLLDDLITEDYALEVLGLKNLSDFRKFSRSFMKLSKIVKGIEDGKANSSHTHDDPDIVSLDASKLKGTIDIARLPTSALERCVVVADDTARFKLTKSQVQNGDSVKVTSPDNLMYIVVDDNKLNSADGYIAYSAAVKWETIKDKPSTFPPSSHTHDDRYYTETEINSKLNEKANTNHTHDDRYYTESEIDTKFKNFCPFPVGSVLPMWNETNPTSLYLGTTWELISAGKYIQTGSKALQVGGSNSLKIEKTNLPAVKIQLDAFSLSRGTMDITGRIGVEGTSSGNSGAFYRSGSVVSTITSGWNNKLGVDFQASRAWTGTTNTAQPQTINLGDGTPLNIQPSYITLKFWKRTS